MSRYRQITRYWHKSCLVGLVRESPLPYMWPYLLVFGTLILVLVTRR